MCTSIAIIVNVQRQNKSHCGNIEEDQLVYEVNE